MELVAKWKGTKQGRGHWRLICGRQGCPGDLGMVEPLNLPNESPTTTVMTSAPGESHYRLDNPSDDASYALKRNERHGPRGEPRPARGGKGRNQMPEGVRHIVANQQLVAVVAQLQKSGAEDDGTLTAEEWQQLRARFAEQAASFPVVLPDRRVLALPATVGCPLCHSPNRLQVPVEFVLKHDADGQLLLLRPNDPPAKS